MLGRKVLPENSGLLYNVRIKDYIARANDLDEEAYTEFYLAFDNNIIKLTGTMTSTLLSLNIVAGDVVTLIAWGADESRHLDGLCKIIDPNGKTPAELQHDILLADDTDPEGAPLGAKIESLITAPRDSFMSMPQFFRTPLPDPGKIFREFAKESKKPAPKRTVPQKQEPVFLKDLPEYEEKIMRGADPLSVGTAARSVLALLPKDSDKDKIHLPYMQVLFEKLDVFLKYAPTPENKESIKSSVIVAPICFVIVWLLLTNPLVKWLFSGEWISIAAMLVFALIGMIGLGFIGAAIGFFGSGLVFSFADKYIPTDTLVLWVIAGAVGIIGVVCIISAVSDLQKMSRYRSKAKQDEGNSCLRKLRRWSPVCKV